MRQILSTCVMILSLMSMGIPAHSAGNTWSVPGDFATIQQAIDSALVATGDTILVSAGDHAGARVTKGITINGLDGARIVDGPVLSPFPILGAVRKIAFFATFSDDAQGASINNLSIVGGPAPSGGDLSFGVFMRSQNNITVGQNTFSDMVQAVTSSFGGKGWNIQHNKIENLRTICGGGIGIITSTSNKNPSKNHMIAHNKVRGTLKVNPGDCGGYSGTGIVLYSDYRFGRSGGEITGVNVLHNEVQLVSDTPSLVDAVSFELTETAGGPGTDIHDNDVGFNDFRGAPNEIVLTPSNLDLLNDISRNLGENRGQGLHPQALLD